MPEFQENTIFNRRVTMDEGSLRRSLRNRNNKSRGSVEDAPVGLSNPILSHTNYIFLKQTLLNYVTI